MNTILFYVQLIFNADMLPLIRCRKHRSGIQMEEKQQDVEHDWNQSD